MEMLRTTLFSLALTAATAASAQLTQAEPLEVAARCHIESDGTEQTLSALAPRNEYINLDTAIALTLSGILAKLPMRNDGEVSATSFYVATSSCVIKINGKAIRESSPPRSVVRGYYWTKEDAIGESIFKAFRAAGLEVRD